MTAAERLAERIDQIAQGQVVIAQRQIEILNAQDALLDLMDDARSAAWFARRCGLSLAAVMGMIRRAEDMDGRIPKFEAQRTGKRLTWAVSAKDYRNWYTRERMAALRAMARTRATA